MGRMPFYKKPRWPLPPCHGELTEFGAIHHRYACLRGTVYAKLQIVAYLGSCSSSPLLFELQSGTGLLTPTSFHQASPSKTHLQTPSLNLHLRSPNLSLLQFLVKTFHVFLIPVSDSQSVPVQKKRESKYDLKPKSASNHGVIEIVMFLLALVQA